MGGGDLCLVSCPCQVITDLNWERDVSRCPILVVYVDRVSCKL